MRVGAPGTITVLTEDELPEAEALLARAFQVPQGFFGRRLERYLALNPRTWLVLRAPGSAAPVGVVGANVFGGCAYIGLMGIEPSAQRQGHGEHLMRVLMDSLPREGAHTFMLDASTAGAPLYARLGFVTVGHAGEWHRASPQDGEALVPATRAAPDDPAREATPDDERYVLGQVTSKDDEREVTALDSDFFGFDRTSLWTRLGQEERGARTLVLRDEGGRAVGYLCLQQGLLAGPFGAATPRAAAALLRSALSQESSFARGGRVLVPSDNADAPALLREAGFHEARRLAHMRLVLPAASRGDTEKAPLWSRIYGKGSFCLG